MRSVQEDESHFRCTRNRCDRSGDGLWEPRSLSGAGVAFSRNPWTGVNELLVDFKFGAQGEDIVSGLMGVVSQEEFAARIPLAARELSDAAKRLESLYRDMQDIEFTVQEGKLFILQGRSGKRAPLAALKIAVDLVQEKR